MRLLSSTTLDGVTYCGSTILRWVSATIVETEERFRRVQGWRGIEKLVRSLNVIEGKEEETAERVA